MNTNVIVVAGGTGDLGERIIKSLLKNGTNVRALVRSTSNRETVKRLELLGAKCLVVDMANERELVVACTGASCVVSAVAGFRDTIVDTQLALVKAAIASGVPRFIPSDYSLDFTKFSDGENRNLDLRREFHTLLDTLPIRSTTIFNGAFADMLMDQIPMINSRLNLILYWGKADKKMIFTSMDDTAAFTALAALDATTPRYLRIAGDQISAREIRTLMSTITGEKYRLIRTGGQALLGLIIKIARRIAPAEKDLYPAWQGMQYMHNMIDERSDVASLDNNRYPAMTWTTVKDILSAHYRKTGHESKKVSHVA